MSEMPSLATMAYTSSSLDINKLAGAAGYIDASARRIQANNPFIGHMQVAPTSPTVAPEKSPMANQRRLVQVFIADPNENVPLEDALIYKGEQKFTDLTDQELFFEIDMKAILDAHNAKRVKMVNKAVKERTEHLEPARIRDLKMTVVNIASF